MSQETIISHIQKPKRSSLKNANLLSPLEILNYSKKKRNSVSFGGNIKFNELKTKFEEIKNEEKEKNLKNSFLEIRKRSIKNEFSIVKELLKKQNAIEEVEEEENVKENTENNIKMGKDFQNCENEKNNFEEQNINQDTFEDIDCPKTNREELQQLEEKKKEINQTCKFC